MPDESRNQRLLRLFAEGSELPVSERAGFVERESADDAALRAELGELLELAQDDAGGFLAEPVVVGPAELTPMDLAPEVPAAPAASPPPLTPRIDGYQDLEPIAEGGMGSVYRAQQVDPVRRTVAIKVIRPGPDTADLVRRFDNERQALALMTHPYIAAVHDAGVDELGRPYLAMEFVDGVPITQYCADRGLDLTARLELFVKVCEAVEHAHRRGVLHRDLKPSNVLVARVGDQAIPKVIDFGIAKALEGSLGDQSIHTLEGTLLGTPEYMSPEQIEGNIGRVDTRSDVFALGVILYELLALARPVDSDRLRESGFAHMHRILTEEAPPKPSARLSGLMASGDLAGPLPGDPSRWVRRISGDLDWIVLKALEKDPDQRFGSANELASDVQAFLEDRPVSAGPPSGLYLVRKFTRRHRAQVVAAGLVLLSLIIGLFGTLWFLFESLDSQAAAEQRASEAEAARREADGVRLATEASLLVEESPNLALLLALEASRATDSGAVHQTIHRALPQLNRVAEWVAHDYGSQQALYLPDGRLLTRGRVDSFVCLWDPDTNALARRFGGDWSEIRDMAVDAAGSLVATAAENGTVRIWSIDRDEDVRCASDSEVSAECVVLSPDGRWCVVGSADGHLRIHDATTGALLHERAAADAGPLDLAISPSGDRVGVISSDRVARIFEVPSGVPLDSVELGPQLPDRFQDVSASICFSADGSWTLASHNARALGDLRTVVRSRDARIQHDLTGASAASFIAGERVFFERDRECCFLSLADGSVVSQPWESEELRGALEATPDGRFALAVDLRRDLCLVDLDRRQISSRLRGDSDKRPRYVDLACHPDGTKIAVTGIATRVWNLEPTFAPVDLPLEGVRFRANSIARGAETLVVAELGPRDAPSYELWSVDRVRRLARFEPGLRELRPSPRGTCLLGVEDATQRAVVFDLTGERLVDFALPEARLDLEFTADESSILVTHGSRADGELLVHDATTGALMARHALRADVSSARRFVAPSEAIPWLRAVTTTLLFDVLDGSLVARAEGPTNASHTNCALSSDGRLLVVTDGAFKATVWDLAAERTGVDAIPLSTYRNLVYEDRVECGFADDDRLAWVRCANEVHLFDARTGELFSVIRLDNSCGAVAVGPQGRWLYTVTIRGRCQRWPIRTVEVADELAVGQLDRRDLDTYRIGTPGERRERERQALRARPTPYGHAKLGELALADGDLDEAIACYERARDLQPLGHASNLYLELAELLCRRLDSGGAVPDAEAAVQALEIGVRYGATPEDLARVPGLERLAGTPGADRFLADRAEAAREYGGL